MDVPYFMGAGHVTKAVRIPNLLMQDTKHTLSIHSAHRFMLTLDAGSAHYVCRHSIQTFAPVIYVFMELK